MKRISTRLATGLLLAAVVAAVLHMSFSNTSASAKFASSPGVSADIAVACPGRIEGRSDTIAVGAAIDGVLQSIKVREGQTVPQGAVLAELECSDLAASLQVARSEKESLEQARIRLLRGSREEERQAAAQKTAAARAVLEQAAAQVHRMEQLWEASAVSRAAFDEARRDAGVAEAGLKQAMRNEELVNAGPLAEEVARADADVRAAEDRIRLAEDKLSKCVIRAPISGTILRVNLRQGESFALLAPRPLFSMADLSGRRVRAEVDERDVGKVRVGQRLLVTAGASADHRFEGTVTRLSPIMGRKSIITGDPVDKSDRDIMEVHADLDKSATALPIGLRVTVQFLR